MKLIHEDTKQRVKIGDEFMDFRGDTHIVRALHEPSGPSSEGHVSTDHGYFYASVIGAKWVDRKDQPVCPNCDQWADSPKGDCLNECKKRGFA